MVLPLIPLAAGVAARAVGSRLVAGAAAKTAAGAATGTTGPMAAGRALQFGGSALQLSGSRSKQQRPANGGLLGPKGEATLGVLASGVLAGSSISQRASQDFDSIMQSGQFK